MNEKMNESETVEMVKKSNKQPSVFETDHNVPFMFPTVMICLHFLRSNEFIRNEPEGPANGGSVIYGKSQNTPLIS